MSYNTSQAFSNLGGSAPRTSTLPGFNPGPSNVVNPYASSAYATSRGTANLSSARGSGGYGGGGVSMSGGGMGGMGGMGGSVGMGGPVGMDSMYGTSRSKGNMQGKWKDAVTTAKAAANNDEWKTIVVKATRHHPAPPKPKWVRRIVEGLRWGGSISNRESPVGGIFYHLRKRLMQNEWIVVLKTLTIFHHIFREGNEKFTAYVAASSRDMFAMPAFSDMTGEGRAHAGFIKSYGAYIEQWCAMKAAIDFPKKAIDRSENSGGSERYRNASMEELFAGLPVMMDTLEKLFELELGGHIRYTPAARPAIPMVLWDLTQIWVALTEGMIRLLDLYFELPQDKAPIGVDIYKRYIAIVERARTFFNMANELENGWKAPETTVVSTDLIESMEDYAKNGPQKERIEPEADFSSEEEYEAEPEPEPYYEPEPEYYSEEELPPPPPPPRPRTPTPEPEPEPSSSSGSEEEEESSEEEPEPEAPPPPPPKPAPPKPFDPLADLLGIEDDGPGAGGNATVNGMANGQVAVYNPATAAMYQRAMFENTMQDRVNNVKHVLANGGVAAQNPNRGHVGMMGMHNTNNLQVALVAQQQQQQQANPYATNMYQTNQQQLVAYQTAVAYQYQTQYNNQMALMQMQQQRGGHMGMMGSYVPAPRGDNIVPAMNAEKAGATAPQNYRVKRGTKPTRVNSDDSAFGPLLDQMKNIKLGGK